MKINYRPEIDGLRAIAVFAVILYHANLSLFGHPILQGGFLGVDIFFVISGYLITTIILEEIYENGQFSFLNFYERRIRRIIPVLLFVIIVSIPFAYFYLLPSSLIDFSKSILYSLGFLSNYYYYNTGQIYGAENALLKPLLHFWSLSVEGQFYIFFPAFLVIIFKFFKRYILAILIIFFLLSLLFGIYYSKIDSSFNFYILPSRIFELLSGAILSFLELNNPNKKFNQNNAFYYSLPFFGIVLIFYSLIFLNFNKIFHPSTITLIPVVGICLVIWFSKKDEIITKILSSKIFVFFGLISYSLYLWHYPVFAIYRYSFADGMTYKKLSLPIIIIILSIFSFYLIEKPFRNFKKIKTKNLIFILFFLLITIIGIAINFIYYEGYKKRFIYKGVSIDRNDYELEIGNWLRNSNTQDVFDKNHKNVLIIGNSHARDMYLIFKTNQKLYKNYAFKTSSFKNLLDYLNKKQNNADFAKDFSDIENAKIILLSNRFLNDEDSYKNLEQLETIIPEFKKLNKKIILTTENISAPSSGINSFTMFNKFILHHQRLPSEDELFEMEKKYFTININDPRLKKINNDLNNISKKYNIKLLNKSLYRCDYIKKTCAILTPMGDQIFLDSTHTTLKANKYFGEKIYKMHWFDVN
jgi:peptidoglycan/LPS O-acetylase OafA/YrhL